MPTSPLETLLDEFATVLSNDRGALDPTDDWYVPHLHGSGAEDVVQTLFRAIRRTSGSQLYYFSGQRGTGKSTELRRLAVELNGQPGVRAFILDVLDYISDSHPIETVDLLLITTLALADRLKERDALAEDFLKEDSVTRLATWLRTEVEITGMTVGGVKGEFKKQQQSIIARIRAFDLARRERIMTECREFIREMSGLIRARLGVEKVVLLIDSLERLRGIGNAATDMFDRVVRVFDGDIHQLRLPEVQVVYAVPPYLPYLSNVKAQVPLFMLASVRVCEPPTAARRQPRVAGLSVMRRVVEKRFSRWAELLTAEALDELALKSGGDLRQLLKRFLLDALDQAYYALERLPLQKDDPIIGITLSRHQVEFESMVTRDEYSLLKSIVEKNWLDLPKREDLPTAARFFEIRALLNYRNGTDWLDINPLLWPLIDAFQPPSSSATGHDGAAATT